MKIRKTTIQDLPKVMEIYAQARALMVETGNPTQWGQGHPAQWMIEADIAQGLSYVCEQDTGEIGGVFYFSTDPDPTYAQIDGAWQNHAPYGVVHRIARGENAKGVGAFCLEWCYQQTKNVRIDTHENNAPMLQLLEKLGYVYCGIVWLAEIGETRMAFQKCEA